MTVRDEGQPWLRTGPPIAVPPPPSRARAPSPLPQEPPPPKKTATCMPGAASGCMWVQGTVQQAPRSLMHCLLKKASNAAGMYWAARAAGRVVTHAASPFSLAGSLQAPAGLPPNQTGMPA